MDYRSIDWLGRLGGSIEKRGRNCDMVGGALSGESVAQMRKINDETCLDWGPA